MTLKEDRGPEYMSIPILHRRILIPLTLILGYSPQLWGLNLKVGVEGVAGELESNVRSYLQIYQEREDPKLLPSRVRYLHAQAETQIGQALQPFGYFRPVVAGELKEQKDGQDTFWEAGYVIDPGDPIRVAAVEYRLTGEGASDAAFPRAFPLAQGDVLDQRCTTRARRNCCSVPQQTVISSPGCLPARSVSTWRPTRRTSLCT